ncbi:DNA polymerase [Pectobacterium phage PPWS1]|uniref:DNA polymerase n=1 Tax=Pectobacterium phage PPWS1 TaxID=1685500 RepID=A0A0P0UWD7_9CAUD|nr:DNA polymerase [Pectobacterium phage PPWS1]BAS69533.1 DNA polymerase [Pectobacterium phage PPWS1]
MYKIIHVDLETENHDWYGNVASAFNPANYIVAPGWRVDTVNDDGTVAVGQTHHRYFGTAAEADAGADWFNVLDECTIMVCHNAQFEIKWFLSKYRDRFETFLKRGGRVACTALAEYLLSHQQELYPSLDETAVKHGGTHKVDGVKILWEQGYLTSQIDKALLIEYLAGPNGDIDNTALTFYSQQQKLAAAGMTLMYWERCDALLAFAYCEWFGLYVDREVAERNLAAQEAEIAELTEKLRSLLPPDLPDEVEFNWGSDYHMSALVYGGPVKYRHRVPYDPPQYVKADFYQTETDGTLVRCDDPLLDQELVAAGQHNFVRYKSGKNKGQVKVFREDTSEEKLKWEETSVVLPGLVNLHSLPEGIREKYIGKRAEFKGARLLCDGVTPVYSTSTDALKGLKNFVPEVGLMVKLAALEKDTGTYYLRTEYNADGSVKKTKGMMQYIGPDGIVHHSLNVTATVTTRLSSSNP